jgi:hypothetical protein
MGKRCQTELNNQAGLKGPAFFVDNVNLKILIEDTFVFWVTVNCRLISHTAKLTYTFLCDYDDNDIGRDFSKTQVIDK